MLKIVKRIKYFFLSDEDRRKIYLKEHPYGVYVDKHGREWFNSEYRTGHGKIRTCI